VKFLRHLAWPIALLPVMAAFVWSSFASRLPESEEARRALGEATMRWHFAEITALQSEPAHLLARAVHIAALQVPGSSFWWAAAANALLALLLAFVFAAVARRALGLDGVAHAVAIGLGGLLVCSPAFGADWLHGERVGLFLVPLLLLWATWLLLGTGRFAARALVALLPAIAAPFCHTNGLLVFVALAPALVDAAQRAGSSRRMGWVITLLVCGNLAAIGSMWFAPSLALGEQGLVGRLMAAPTDTLLLLLRTTGTAWLDPLHDASWDETALGAASWLLPLVLWRLGDRSDAARRRAAPWWGCVWFGLSLFVLATERHGASLVGGMVREQTFGAFLLPVGCFGVLAARCGAALIPFGAGVLMVLAAQDFYRGIEDLRLARMQVERAEVLVQLPEAYGGTLAQSRDRLEALREVGWVPATGTAFGDGLRSVDKAAKEPDLGGVIGGDARSVHGIVRSSLTGDSVQCVVVTAAGSTAQGGGEQVLGVVLPEYAGMGRNTPWVVAFAEPLAEGTRVRISGYCVRRSAFVALAPVHVVRGGKLVAATDG
jgi:hypothetical protein